MKHQLENYNDLIDAKPISIYPNPVSSWIIVQSNDAALSYSIIDLTGRIIMTGQIKEGKNLLLTTPSRSLSHANTR